MSYEGVNEGEGFAEYSQGGQAVPPIPPGATMGGRRRRRTRRGKSGKRKGNIRRKTNMNRKKSQRRRRHFRLRRRGWRSVVVVIHVSGALSLACERVREERARCQEQPALVGIERRDQRCHRRLCRPCGGRLACKEWMEQQLFQLNWAREEGGIAFTRWREDGPQDRPRAHSGGGGRAGRAWTVKLRTVNTSAELVPGEHLVQHVAEAHDLIGRVGGAFRERARGGLSGEDRGGRARMQDTKLVLGQPACGGAYEQSTGWGAGGRSG